MTTLSTLQPPLFPQTNWILKLFYKIAILRLIGNSLGDSYPIFGHFVIPTKQKITQGKLSIMTQCKVSVMTECKVSAMIQYNLSIMTHCKFQTGEG